MIEIAFDLEHVIANTFHCPMGNSDIISSKVTIGSFSRKREVHPYVTCVLVCVGVCLCVRSWFAGRFKSQTLAHLQCVSYRHYIGDVISMHLRIPDTRYNENTDLNWEFAHTPMQW